MCIPATPNFHHQNLKLTRDRHLREISFDQQKMIGKFPYYDFFGDGSFYLLDVPGVSLIQTG